MKFLAPMSIALLLTVVVLTALSYFITTDVSEDFPDRVISRYPSTDSKPEIYQDLRYIEPITISLVKLNFEYQKKVAPSWAPILSPNLRELDYPTVPYDFHQNIVRVMQINDCNFKITSPLESQKPNIDIQDNTEKEHCDIFKK